MEGLDKREADAAAGSSDDVRDHDSSEQENIEAASDGCVIK